MVARFHPDPPTVLEVQSNGHNPPSLRANGQPLAVFRSAGSGRDTITVARFAEWFRVTSDAVRRWATAGMRTTTGETIRLELHGHRNRVPLHAVSRFLRRLAECGPLASGGRKPAPYGAYVIHSARGFPLVINGVPQVEMTDAKYASLIGETPAN